MKENKTLTLMQWILSRNVLTQFPIFKRFPYNQLYYKKDSVILRLT